MYVFNYCVVEAKVHGYIPIQFLPLEYTPFLKKKIHQDIHDCAHTVTKYCKK